MPFSFGNITPQVIADADKKPGHSDVVLFARVADFETIATPTSPWAAPGDSVKITTAHAFPEGGGFFSLQCKAKSIDPTGDAQGEAGGQVPTFKYKCIVKGDSPEILEWVLQALNEDFVVLFNSPECGKDEYIQIGGKCTPANLNSFAFRGGNKGNGGFKEYEFVVESSDKFFYNGTVTKLPDA
ncbi:hypothetical protein QEG73_21925 [Chitinophagaceae bacterium 26-R-25]|nr:hypothetical protein [Chitinophagaceae bacterium 26-R-25]